MDNELIVNEKERKKEKRKLYRDIVFIVLFGLLIIWFTGSFLANRSNYNDNQELSSKTELVSRSINYSNVNNDNNDNNVSTNRLVSESQTTAVFIYELVTYNGLFDINGSLNEEYIRGVLSIYLDVNTYQITSAQLIYSGWSVDADDDFHFSYEFESEDLQYLKDKELFAIVSRLCFIGGEYDPDNSEFYFENDEGTYYSDSIYHNEEFYFRTLNENILVYIESVLDLTPVYTEIENYISIKTNYQSFYDVGYDEGYDVGFDEGYIEGIDATEETAYEKGFVDGQKDTINEKGFKTLFNAIMNAPYNIFKGILNFEFLGVNLFSLFSFIFTTMLILWIVKIFKK